MRTSDAKRNKSCGCLKRDKWHQHQVNRKPKIPIDQLPESVWTQFDSDIAPPATICAKVSALGLYVPQWKPDPSRKVDATKKISS